MPRPKLIYLASPYSFNGTSSLLKVEERFLKVCNCAGYLFKQGLHVYSPIAHTHPIKLVTDDMPGGWEFWAGYDENMIERCDELYVLTLKGWLESVGVIAEVAIALKLNKPVWYVSEDNISAEYFIHAFPPTK